ncbi:hypothetical protein IZ6_24880 [Terrihabitans soli]|uniref:Uncharacterized protein n=1 Tax=Terrihabitans soli TaxID=708113 RepID=A0A6S6QKC7_9HYPH|nr:hypothetical protein [Terrihabitans soli]BCJ91753.1 hypothetical protein IZ6_24880 [Terrihabitans soli]
MKLLKLALAFFQFCNSFLSWLKEEQMKEVGRAQERVKQKEANDAVVAKVDEARRADPVVPPAGGVLPDPDCRDC